MEGGASCTLQTEIRGRNFFYEKTFNHIYKIKIKRKKKGHKAKADINMRYCEKVSIKKGRGNRQSNRKYTKSTKESVKKSPGK